MYKNPAALTFSPNGKHWYLKDTPVLGLVKAVIQLYFGPNLTLQYPLKKSLVDINCGLLAAISL